MRFTALKKFLSKIGPGFITGAADDDPSGIATYSMVGAQHGLAYLWLVPFVLPLMIAIQEMCGRIGKVTNEGLTTVVKKNYGRTVLIIAFILLFCANTINIGADLGAMASSFQMLLGLPFWLWVVAIGITTALLETIIPYKIYSKLLILLGLSLLSYVITVFIITNQWQSLILATFIPSLKLDRSTLMLLVAFLGTTISPYLFFWQSTNEVEEEIASKRINDFGGKEKVFLSRIKNMQTDTIIGMSFSQIVTWFIIVTCAMTLFNKGITDIQTAQQAASALKPLAGDAAYLLFTIGIVGIGLQSIPVLAGGIAYAFSEIYDLPEGLSKKPSKAKMFYFVIAFTTLLGILFNLFGFNPITMLFYAAIINGVLAVPLILLILLITNNKKIMGAYTNRFYTNIISGVALLAMGISAVYLIVDLI
jgi:NRAMP (natural resistance-associated macrophage protein)-like metal ion transporter